jgi:hypothetical protein
MTSVQEALDYLHMGFSIIPLRSRDKVPAIPSWKEYQDRLPTENEVKAWFTDESLNVGIICGNVSGGLVVVDFDSSEAIPFVIPNIEVIARKTMVVRTGKGFHVYYRHKDVPSTKFANLKIDVQSEGKYVVAPPSYHPSGVQYTRIGTLTVMDAPDSLVPTLSILDEMYPIAKVVATRWIVPPPGGQGNRHELTLRLASFFKARARWNEEYTTRFIRGVMQLKNDTDGLNDRLRAISDAYEKDYGYSGLPADLIEEIVRLLPRGIGELWAYYYKGKPEEPFWSAFVCRNDGVFRVLHKKIKTKDGNEQEIDDELKIFSQPLVLADAWHGEGDDENQIRFTFFLGDLKYQGTKGEVSNLITESGLTGIVPTDIKLAVAACVEYYISAKMVKVRESYEAIGIYESNNKFEIALADKDISATRGTEPWFVFRSFRRYGGNIKEDFERFNRLWEFFPRDTLAFLYGISAISPFSYAMKKDGDFFWPLVVLKGPRGTGKTTLGQLFTSFLYGVGEGGPSDVTSDFRLLDFVTGTTFPRLIDESENAKFEGQKFSLKISTTLKDAAQKQFVGSRGNLDKTKKLYAARTPLILAGNKIDIEDPALMARSIFINFDATEMKSQQQRRTFSDEILKPLKRGFGIELVNHIVSKFSRSQDLMLEIKNKIVNYQFSDPRREDFYGAVFIGLHLWDEFYRSLGISFSLSDYLNENTFIKLVRKFEEVNIEESQERQSILALVDWTKSRIGLLESLETVDEKKSTVYYEIREMFKRADRDGKEWGVITQTALNEFRKTMPSFQETTLSEAAESLSKYYGVRKEVFYDRKTERVGQRPARVLYVPMEDIGLDSYGGYTSGDAPEPPPDEKCNQCNQHVTSTGYTSRDRIEVVPQESVTTLRKNVYTHEGIDESPHVENIDSSGYMVTHIEKNLENTKENSVTKSVTSCNQWLQNNKVSEEIQLTEDLQSSNNSSHLPYKEAPKIPMLFREDISLAWYDRDVHYHAQDVAYVPLEWAPLLEKRGTARILHFSDDKGKVGA